MKELNSFVAAWYGAFAPKVVAGEAGLKLPGGSMTDSQLAVRISGLTQS